MTPTSAPAAPFPNAARLPHSLPSVQSVGRNARFGDYRMACRRYSSNREHFPRFQRTFIFAAATLWSRGGRRARGNDRDRCPHGDGLAPQPPN